VKPTVGARLLSTACATEVIVVRPPSEDVALTCGGTPMAGADGAHGELSEPEDGGTLVGKRYEHPASGLELLCTKGGAGRLRVDDVPLDVKAAKNLPSSD